MHKSFRTLFSVFFLTALLISSAYGAQADYSSAVFSVEGFSQPQRVYDATRSTYSSSSGDARVTVSHEDGIASLYIEFDRLPKTWTLTDPATGVSVTCGENSFLHEFVDVSSRFSSLPSELELSFPAGTAISDIYAFSPGDLPDWVQVWQPPCEEADLLLISSHSDDEQLFFAGILPYYAIERQLSVQVAYIVQHFEAYNTPNHQRPHEQLDGLWTVGVRNYPVMSDFPDLYAESKDRNTAFQQAEKVFATVGVTYDDFISYITECIRRFKPLVVVSHDLNGEYGHGTHVLCSSALTEAVEYAADATRYPESADSYGTWQVEKTYLHLYPENPIVMNWDTPLESLGGKTPFQVTQDGFGCHKSQHWTWFYRWIYGSNGVAISKASEISTYSPCEFGLYQTTVGPDVNGGDFFENVETYAQRAEAARLAEEAKKAEEARKAEEEAARKAKEEAEKKAAEEAQKKAALEAEEAERKSKEEAERIRLEQEATSRRKDILTVSVSVGACIVLAVLYFIVRRRR